MFNEVRKTNSMTSLTQKTFFKNYTSILILFLCTLIFPIQHSYAFNYNFYNAINKKKDFEVELFNYYNNKKIKFLEGSLENNDAILKCSNIKRDYEGKIISIHIKLITSKGKVEGTYTNFVSIKIFSSSSAGMGIEPSQYT
jgi:hypothetical protein